MEWLNTVWHFLWEHVREGGVWFWLFIVSEILAETRRLKDNSVFQMVRRVIRLIFLFKSGSGKKDLDGNG